MMPLLRVLAGRPEGMASGQAVEEAADALGLSPADRAAELPSGGPAYRNRIAWAQVRLKKDGLTDSPTKGIWRITDRGRAFLQASRV